MEPGLSPRLLDLGVVRLPGLEDVAPGPIPGTHAYMAPEMLGGEAGTIGTDLFALGVSLFRALTGQFPYGNLDAISLQFWQGLAALLVLALAWALWWR